MIPGDNLFGDDDADVLIKLVPFQRKVTLQKYIVIFINVNNECRMCSAVSIYLFLCVV